MSKIEVYTAAATKNVVFCVIKLSSHFRGNTTSLLQIPDG
jgi:hypothetical protein